MVGLFKDVDGCKVATFAYLKADSNTRLTPQDFLSDVFGKGVKSNNFISIINIKNPQETYHYGKVRYRGRIYNCTALCTEVDNTETLIMVYSTKSEKKNKEKAFELFPSISDSITISVLRGVVTLELSSLPKNKVDTIKRKIVDSRLRSLMEEPMEEKPLERYILSH